MKRYLRIRTFGNCERGDTMIEFAISAIVVLMVLLGIMDISRAAYTYHFVSYAAQQGARFAEVHGSSWGSSCSSSNGTYPNEYGCTASNTDVQAYIQGVIPSKSTTYAGGIVPVGIDPSNISVSTTWPGKNAAGATTACATTNYPGCLVKVKVTYNNFNYIMPFFTTSSTLAFNSTAEATIEK